MTMARNGRPTVIGVGEVLWDLLPGGQQLGGAPANFAYHAQSLGARALVVTRVGNDSLGRGVLQRFKDMNLPTGTVQVDDQNPTGTVTVILNNLGVPEFTINENAAWDRMVVTSPALEAVRQADAVCFGSLAQRDPASRATIQQLLKETPAGALRVFDINLRQNFYSREIIEQSLRLANVLKLNDEELVKVAEMFTVPGDTKAQMEWLAENFGLKVVVLTRGPRGSLIYSANRWSEQPGRAVRVVDTVGAGDSFAAALVTGLLSEMEIDEVHAIASEVARYVCSQSGATPPLPEILRSRFANCTFVKTPHPGFKSAELSSKAPNSKQTIL